MTNSEPANGRRGQREGRAVSAEEGGVLVERGATGAGRGLGGPPPAPRDWSAKGLTCRRPGGRGRGGVREALPRATGGQSQALGLPSRRGQSRARLPQRPGAKSQFLILEFKARPSARPA